jgi:hypothetical protein
MFINQSYFRKPLVIAQLGQQSVVDGLNDIIDRWEPVILQAALGYDFYKAFLEGLDVGSDEVIEQRWLDLLNGVAFSTGSGIRKYWVGFAGGGNSSILVPTQRQPLTIYAGTTTGFPVAGSTYTNTGVKDWQYDLESFGNGTLEYGVDWTYKTGGGFNLLNGYTTSPDERFILHFTGQSPTVVQSGSTLGISPLAGFIYYEYMVDLATQATGIGVVKSESENSITAGPGRKLVDAYNTACRQMEVLFEYLQANLAVYPEFSWRQVDNYCGWYNRWYMWGSSDVLYSFKQINEFGI